MRKGRFIHRTTCRLCQSSDLSLLLDMGYMPLAGNYLKNEQIGTEEYFPLVIYFCNNCTAVQLLDIISFDEIFRDYRYLSSVGLASHFANYAEDLRAKYLTEKSFVVEIGSNDGVLLKPLQDMGAHVLGVDPAENVAGIARQKGVETLADFFTKRKAEDIVSRYGHADVIVANNVLAHIDDMHDIARGINTLLHADGVLVFEVHYLLDLIRDLQYDFFYPGEHITYYSLHSIIMFYEQFGMEVFDVQQVPTHGGSLRVFVKKKVGKKGEQTKRFLELLKREDRSGLLDKTLFAAFAKRVKTHKEELHALLMDLKKQRKKIVGYGAAGRGNTLLNYCGIDTNILDYIVDASPERYGRYTPGTHIPIVPPEDFRNDTPDYALILAWSYAAMIREKEKLFEERGGSFILPLPQIALL